MAQDQEAATRVSVVQQAPHEAVWVRGDSGICNLAYVRSFAIHEVAGGWMVWAHSAMRDSKAIPLVKVLTEQAVNNVLDELARLVGALDVRTATEGS